MSVPAGPAARLEKERKMYHSRCGIGDTAAEISTALKAVLILTLLCGSRAAADMVQDLVYINENGTADLYSKSCPKKNGYMCKLSDITTNGVSTVTFGGAFSNQYGVIPGNILVQEPDSDPWDLISFPATVTDKSGRKLASSVMFSDTKATSLAGATLVKEVDLSGEADTFTDGTAINLPSMKGATGYAFTVSGSTAIGSSPNYPDTIIRYVFVSDSDPVPEPSLIIPLGASIVILLWLKRRSERRGPRPHCRP